MDEITLYVSQRRPCTDTVHTGFPFLPIPARFPPTLTHAAVAPSNSLLLDVSYWLVLQPALSSLLFRSTVRQVSWFENRLCYAAAWSLGKLRGFRPDLWVGFRKAFDLSYSVVFVTEQC